MKKMLITVVLLALLSLSLCLTGCGGKPNEPRSPEAASLLGDVSQAMSNVSSYRATGSITWDGLMRAGSEDYEDAQGEIQVINGETHSHYLSTNSNPQGLKHNVDSYVIGEQLYVHDSIWTQGNSTLRAFYTALEGVLLNGVANPTQLSIMAATAQDFEISDEDSDKTTLTFHLAKDYVDSRMAFFKNELEQSGRWIDNYQQQQDQLVSSDWQADVTLSIFKANNLIDHMETQSTMTAGSDSHQETIKTAYSFSDYNQNITVELPEEAKNAPNMTP